MTGRVHDFEARRIDGSAKMRALVQLEEAGRTVRRKPRTAEQERMIHMMARSAIRERLESGRLERIGPREYVLHPRIAPDDAPDS